MLNMNVVAWNSDELESVPCDLCGSNSSRKLYTRSDGMTVEECIDCGLAFLNPRPRAEYVAKLYDESYFRKPSASSLCGYSDYLCDDYRWNMIDQARIRLAALNDIWSPGGKRCLEAGCASGEFCRVLAQSGAVTTGVD